MAGIGDTILATPLIHELRASFPRARIDALVLWPGSKDILEGNPHLNNVYQQQLMKQSKLASFRFLWSIRKHGYHISINTHPQSRRHYRVIARIIGAPIRISHRYESFGPFDRFLVHVQAALPQDYSRHSADMNLDVLNLLEARPRLPSHELELFLSPQDEAWADSFLDRHALRRRQILGIHTGSGGTKNLVLKRWPLGQYMQLVAKLRQNLPELAIVLFGGPDEQADIDKVLAVQPSPLLLAARSPNLRAAGALMKRCTAFLSVDTALMHVAAAVKAPRQIVIEAFTLNNTNLPYRQPYTLVPNPAIAGRNLQYYKYDGRGIKGAPDELVRAMSSVTVDAVHETVLNTLRGA